MGCSAWEKKRLCVLTLFACCLAGSASAQQDSSLGRTLVLDSLQPRAPARSLSELMTSRFPGVLVWSSSGTVGTSSRILMRGPNTIFGDGAPLVVVDGMVVDANPASFLSSVGGQQVSRLDDLDPADIASIQVVDGANEGAPFGTGAANGVLVITTKQGEIGPPRFRFTSTQGFSADPHTFPASFTPGPGGLPQVNPLEDPATSPFRNGYVRDYRGEVTGGWAPATYYLSAHWEGVGGVYGLPASEQERLSTAGTLHPEDLNPNDLSRLNLRAGGRFAIGHQLDVKVSGGLLSSSLRLPANDNSVEGLLANGELASTTGISPWGFFPPGDLFQVVNTEDVLRLMGTMSAEWRATGWLHVDALVGHESVRQRDGMLQRNGEGPAFAAQRQGVVVQDTLRQASTTYRMTASARLGMGRAVALTTLVGLDTRHYDQTIWDGTGQGLPPGSTSFDDAISKSVSIALAGQTTFGILADEQAAIGTRFRADFGARVDQLKAMGIAGPGTTYPHVGLSWLALKSPGLALESVTLRAGWARVGDYRPGFFNTAPDITSEVEGGADVTAGDGVLRLSVTGYGRHSHLSNVLLGASLSTGTIENTGVILAAEVRLLHTATLNWGAQLGVWGNRNRVADVAGTGFLAIQEIRNGYPLASYFSRQILGYSDANADGVIESGEVQVSNGASFAGNPFPTQGATLGTTLDIGTRLKTGLVMEYRGGNQIWDQAEEFRCQQHLCAGVDTRAPLADQAAAAVAGVVDAPFISDASFFKIREVSLSIAAPDGWVRAIRCTGATLTLAARNVLTWTSYRGLDPEVNSQGAVGLTIADFFTQPPVRTMAARVDLAF